MRRRVAKPAYDPEFDRRVNETWRIFATLRLEIGQDALDHLLNEWVDGRTPGEHAQLVRSRVFLGRGSVYPWNPANVAVSTDLSGGQDA